MASHNQDFYYNHLGQVMYDAVKLIHLVAAIVWIGGMTFMLVALRPAALAMLEAQSRARLMGQVWY